MTAVIAFLGIGLMGRPMAARLAGAGHTLRLWNRTASKAQALQGGAVQAFPELAEAVAGAAIVISMLEDGAIVSEVIAAAQASLQQGALWIDMSSTRHAEALAGILALSTYLPLAECLAAEGSSANKAIPIFMAHGSQDTIVPLTLAEASRDKLKANGYTVRWNTYPMPHSVCIEEIAAVGQWLSERFKSRILLS